VEDQEVKQLCNVIREISFNIHRYLRNGHLERVYENALAHRLAKKGIKFEQQHRLSVFDEDGCTFQENDS
jgi:GxxExxY protein